MPQPAKMSWKDTFASLVVNDTISYKLPNNVKNSDAPSELVIDGFGTLKMERTRVSLDDYKTYRVIHPDDPKKKPMYATAQRANQPRLWERPAAGPGIGVGPGDGDKDTLLFNSKQLFGFGMCLFAALVGACNIPVMPVVGSLVLVMGLIGMAMVYGKAAYHIPHTPDAPVPHMPEELAEAV